MKQSNLIVEFLIIGFFSAVVLLEAYAVLFHVTSFGFLTTLNENKEAVILVVTICLYVLGAIFHRTSQLITFGKLKRLAALVGVHFTDRKAFFAEKYAKVYQYASSGVLEKLAYHESLLRIYRAVFLLFPLIGLLTWRWLAILGFFWQGVFLACVCVGLSLLALVARRMQAADYTSFLERVCKEIEGKG